MTSEVPRYFSRQQVSEIPGINKWMDRGWVVYDLSHDKHPIRWRFMGTTGDLATAFVVYEKDDKSASGYTSAGFPLERKNEIALQVIAGKPIA